MSSWNKKHRVKKCYNLTSNIYNKRYFEEQKDKYKYTLRKLVIKPSYRILDVGCGSGLLFSFIESFVNMIVGIDISDKLLKEAKKGKNKENIHLILADADHLPFMNNKFDIIFAFTILQNMPIPENTLKEIKIKTKDNGKMILTGMKKAFSLEKFRDMLVSAGLNLISIETATNLQDYVAICEKAKMN